ncbi:MAG: hypothetical protein NT116_05620 [Candidatus Parcubacteria bacterium]|nr:hypothetical protein [Candidatus Parcubacteria bacterium]
MEGEGKKAGENETESTFILEGVPLLINWENPENIIGIQAVRMDAKEDALEKIKELINDGYHPEKTLILLGMSTDFAQTNFHKIVTIFVKRGK